MNRVGTLALAFVVTVGVIVGGAAALGLLTADGAAPAPEIENEHYLEEDLISDRTPGEANVTMSSSEPPKTILVDPGIEAAGQRPATPFAMLGFGGPDVADRDIRPLVNALTENGHEVRVYTPEGGGEQRPRQEPSGANGETQLGAELQEADAFVTFRTDYSEAEVDAIESFVEGEGTLLAASDPGDEFGQPAAAAFDSRLGVTTKPGYVYNTAENDLNYQRVYAEPGTDAGLTEGVDRAVFPLATPVGAATSTAELRPIAGSELSTTRAETDAPVLVRSGSVVRIGDTDFLSPENAQRADNDVLIGNIADFLVTGDRPAAGVSEPTGPTEPSEPTSGERQPSGSESSEPAPEA
ncbi:hypothetical protein [Natronomonas sp.]|uniref:hypothetical protein n=1 Tax=Natronomonas sp. TaxID=2184060 RepID=UPI002617B209|nr:hypothetical protein [Natronomonas sp.]